MRFNKESTLTGLNISPLANPGTLGHVLQQLQPLADRAELPNTSCFDEKPASMVCDYIASTLYKHAVTRVCTAAAAATCLPCSTV